MKFSAAPLRVAVELVDVKFRQNDDLMSGVEGSEATLDDVLVVEWDLPRSTVVF